MITGVPEHYKPIVKADGRYAKTSGSYYAKLFYIGYSVNSLFFCLMGQLGPIRLDDTENAYFGTKLAYWKRH